MEKVKQALKPEAPDLVVKMKSGEVIVTDLERLPVGPRCKGESKGSWFCEAHRLALDGTALAVHIGDGKPHRVAWHCRAHGFEQA